MDAFTNQENRDMHYMYGLAISNIGNTLLRRSKSAAEGLSKWLPCSRKHVGYVSGLTKANQLYLSENIFGKSTEMSVSNFVLPTIRVSVLRPLGRLCRRWKINCSVSFNRILIFQVFLPGILSTWRCCRLTRGDFPGLYCETAITDSGISSDGNTTKPALV
ncbi:hypothetical protein AVEN_248695-1 [Araneus ventricosus]|uniref:Uncharacterized protein n=1 Tax=Araneus ventricosus TaxID=182803 RepID=A0A4Y2QGP7_ARAVE|nr:hypothetical protein AVEN_248695-1 [Araneus ventricosus]